MAVHDSLAQFWAAVLPARVFAFTASASRIFTDMAYQAGDVLLFGRNPMGCPRPSSPM